MANKHYNSPALRNAAGAFDAVGGCSLESPSITVVTVALNAAADLPLTIESVLAQSYPDIEYLVVDGLSRDATYDVLARYAGRIDRVLPLEDAGVYHAMNFAAGEARGEFVLFLNAGDRFYCADAVEATVERRLGDPDIFYGDHVYVDGRLESHMRSADFGWLRRRLLHGRIDKDWHLKIPGHQATFTRTSLLRELAYDTRYSICADHEFLLRACDAGARMQYVDEIVAHYVAGGISASQGVLIHREWTQAYRKHSLRPVEVDRFFFQTAAASPFPSRTSYSGLLLSGAHDEEVVTETGKRWRWANQVSMTAPATQPAVGVEISGASLYAGQVLDVAAGAKSLGSKMVGEGGFRLRYAFPEPLVPGEPIRIAAQTVGPVSAGDAREAGWGFDGLHFLPCASLTSTGFEIGSSSGALLDELLIDGWCQPETGIGDVWSEAELASVAFELARPISRLAITCSGNPNTAGGQELSVFVNGQLAGAFRLEPEIGMAICHVDVGGLWREGANIIGFGVDRLAHTPSDPRPLGIALRRIEWN